VINVLARNLIEPISFAAARIVCSETKRTLAAAIASCPCSASDEEEPGGGARLFSACLRDVGVRGIAQPRISRRSLKNTKELMFNFRLIKRL
jgi:hypothetical protein